MFSKTIKLYQHHYTIAISAQNNPYIFCNRDGGNSCFYRGQDGNMMDDSTDDDNSFFYGDDCGNKAFYSVFYSSAFYSVLCDD